MKYKVSVCILTYFHENYIARALQSVLNQKTNFDFEVIISDDCSKDKTIDVVKNFVNNSKHEIHFFVNDYNVGIPQNLFNCIMHSNGEFIALLDGDDYFVDEYKLQRQVDFLDSSFGRDYYGTATILRENIKNKVFYYPKSKYIESAFSLQDFLRGDNFPTNGLMFRNTLNIKSDVDHFYTMVKCSRFVDDLSFCLLILLKGDIYTIDCIGVDYCYKKSKGEHNFNSVNTLYDHFKKHVELLNNFSLFFPLLDLRKRYLKIMKRPYLNALVHLKMKNFNAVYKTIPIRFRRRGLFSLKIKALLSLPKTIFHKMIGK